LIRIKTVSQTQEDYLKQIGRQSIHIKTFYMKSIQWGAGDRMKTSLTICFALVALFNQGCAVQRAQVKKTPHELATHYHWLGSTVSLDEVARRYSAYYTIPPRAQFEKTFVWHYLALRDPDRDGCPIYVSAAVDRVANAGTGGWREFGGADLDEESKLEISRDIYKAIPRWGFKYGERPLRNRILFIDVEKGAESPVEKKLALDNRGFTAFPFSSKSENSEIAKAVACATTPMEALAQARSGRRLVAPSGCKYDYNTVKDALCMTGGKLPSVFLEDGRFSGDPAKIISLVTDQDIPDLNIEDIQIGTISTELNKKLPPELCTSSDLSIVCKLADDDFSKRFVALRRNIYFLGQKVSKVSMDMKQRRVFSIRFSISDFESARLNLLRLLGEPTVNTSYKNGQYTTPEYRSVMVNGRSYSGTELVTQNVVRTSTVYRWIKKGMFVELYSEGGVLIASM
jgi:hypothetical protein